MYGVIQAQHVLSEAKARLEGSMLEGSTNDVVKGVTYIQVGPLHVLLLLGFQHFDVCASHPVLLIATAGVTDSTWVGVRSCPL